VDAGFDENETELRVLVFAVTLEMLADGDGLEYKRQYPASISSRLKWLGWNITFLMSM
jgi:hypothetical protein